MAGGSGIDVGKMFGIYLVFTLIFFVAFTLFHADLSKKNTECKTDLAEFRDELRDCVIENKRHMRLFNEAEAAYNNTFEDYVNLNLSYETLDAEKNNIESRLDVVLAERNCCRDKLESVGGLDDCENAEYPGKRDECLLEYIAEKKNLPYYVQQAVCDEIINVSLRDKCFFYSALYSSQWGFCFQISEESVFQILSCSGSDEVYPLRYYCITQIALKTYDTHTCALIDEIVFRNQCILEIALYSNNPKVCEEIVDREMKESCNDIFSSGGCSCS
ncbi:MAG: hypothetical protein B6U97_04875 [Candidatus Altiarchaeales archaeon ex4484_96]|nr:MAG: hypothetical protein B6U97_04875 [Candidatus Altiarchaeales archaeon ex4484_96]